MSRLNKRALEILLAEVSQCAGTDQLSQTEKLIVMQRLEKLRLQAGDPATEEELRDTVVDVFPQFSEKALKAAAKANSPSPAMSLMWWPAALFLGAAGLIYVVNLPFPMIRRPVAKMAPNLLLPSYMSMDRNYRGAIATIEQADQLINKATSAADLELGAQKVKKAQSHLDALPVWFLGDYPRGYCSLFSCTWQFSFDEFESARKQVGRMETKVYQEQNAQTLLTEGTAAVNKAKQQYQQAQDGAEKQEAIAAWQEGMDLLNQIPPQTLAARMGKTQLAAYRRDFLQVSSQATASNRSDSLIAAAKQFGWAAANAAQNPPHTAAEWQEISRLWEQGIDRLKRVPLGDPAYVDAQKKLAQYQQNLGVVRTRRQAEIESVKALRQAKNLTAQLQTPAGANTQRGLLLQRIVNELEIVQPGTTATAEAENLLKSTRTKIQELEQQAELESAKALRRAQDLIAEWQNLARANANRSTLARQLQIVMNELEMVQPGTTSTAEAENLLLFARTKMLELQRY